MDQVISESLLGLYPLVCDKVTLQNEGFQEFFPNKEIPQWEKNSETGDENPVT